MADIEKRPILKNRVYLYLTELFAGMSVMAVELGASRLLAPYFSSSQIVWTIIIGTIMIAMALGNIYGGRTADKNPNPDRLYARIIIASIWIALIPVLGNHVTLCVAASINFLLAMVFGFIGFMTSPDHDDEDDAEEGGETREPLNEDYAAEHKLAMPPKTTWFWIAGITGLTSFIYEIVWIRLLSLLMGSSSHSFDQMLSAFILGLAIGSAVSGKLLK